MKPLENIADVTNIRDLRSWHFVKTNHPGYQVNSIMLVSKDTDHERGIVLIQPYTNNTFYRVRLASDSIRIENGRLIFDPLHGERVTCTGSDLLFYIRYDSEWKGALHRTNSGH